MSRHRFSLIYNLETLELLRGWAMSLNYQFHVNEKRNTSIDAYYNMANEMLLAYISIMILNIRTHLAELQKMKVVSYSIQV